MNNLRIFLESDVSNASRSLKSDAHKNFPVFLNVDYTLIKNIVS